MKSNLKYIIAIAVLAVAILILSMRLLFPGKESALAEEENENTVTDVYARPLVLLSDDEIAVLEEKEARKNEEEKMKRIMKSYVDSLPPEDISHIVKDDSASVPESELIMYDYEIYDNDDGDYLHFMRKKEKRCGIRSMIEKYSSINVDSAMNNEGYLFLYDSLGRLIQNPGVDISYEYRKNILTVTVRNRKDGEILRRSTTVYDGKYPVERTLWWYSSGMEKWRGEKEFWAYDSENRMISYRQHDIADTTVGVEAWIRYSIDGRHRGIMSVLLPDNPERNSLEYMEETVFDIYDRPLLTIAYNSFDNQRTEIITEYTYADSVNSSPYDKTVTWYTDGKPHYRICSHYDGNRNYIGDTKYRMLNNKWSQAGGCNFTVKYDDRGNVIMRQIHSSTSSGVYVFEYTYNEE